MSSFKQIRRGVDRCTIRRFHAVALTVSVLSLNIATLVCTVPKALANEGLHRGQFDINVLSSRPYLVSGGSALVEVDVPKQVDLTKVHVYVNTVDVTSA